LRFEKKHLVLVRVCRIGELFREVWRTEDFLASVKSGVHNLPDRSYPADSRGERGRWLDKFDYWVFTRILSLIYVII